jgi:class 3 adenylate cyclase
VLYQAPQKINRIKDRPPGYGFGPPLAAIVAADVAGYSRLMGADEEGTHEPLQAHLHDLIEPKNR